MHRVLLSLFVVGGLVTTAQTDRPSPVVERFGVRHGASSVSRLLPSLPRGGIFLVRGAWLGPDDLVLAAQPFPSELAASSIQIRSVGSGVVYNADMVHAWAFQLAGILPSEIPAGPAELTAVYEGRRSERVEILVVDSMPGLFAVSQQGFGPGVIQNFISPTEQPLNTLTNPASGGQYIILWGTGLGEPAAAEDIRVTVGHLSLKPHYAGPAPGFAGVDQFNVMLPNREDLPTGCYVPVSVSRGLSSTGQVTVAIGDTPGRCDHPWQLSPEKLADLDRGERIKTLQVFLSDEEDVISPTEGERPLPRRRLLALANLDLVNGSGVALLSSQSMAPLEEIGEWCGSSSLRWVMGDFSGGLVQPLPQRPPPPNPLFIPADAGESLEFVGPGGRKMELRRPMPPFDDRYYFNLFDQPGSADLLLAGTWTLRAPGGADVGAFGAAVELPALPAVMTPVAIDLSEDIAVEWTGGSYASGDRVGLQISVRTPNQDDSSRQVRWGVNCSVPAVNGGLTIAANLLENLPTPADGMAIWQFSLYARRDLDIPQLDYADLGFRISQTKRLLID